MIGEWGFAQNDFIRIRDIQKTENLINSVYEVIRIIDGKPLFLEDHYQRLWSSCNNFNYKPLSINEIKNIIKLLVEKNKLTTGNIKIEYRYYLSEVVLFVYQIMHSYPSIEMFNQGVKLKSYQAERPNPNIKQSIINNKIRILTDDLINSSDIFEVVLINANDEVTEGSRTNIFFVAENKVFSAPRSQILEGITRAKVIGIARKLGLEVIEKPVLITNLGSFDGCFLSGTSPKVLPVSALDHNKYDVNNHIIREIIKHYEETIADYCYSFTWD